MGTMTLDARNRAAEIRAWAADNGFDVNQRGAIPKGIVAAFESANGIEPPADDCEAGPDWDSAVTDIIGDPGPPADPAQPPVSSLDEARERIGARNRQPKWAKPDGKRQPRREVDPKVRVTASVRADVEAKLALVLGVVAMPWKTADPYCGGAFADDVEKMAKAWAPLLCQSAEIVRFFTKTSTFMLWVAALGSMQGVASCVYAHHISRSVEILPDGQIFRKDPHSPPAPAPAAAEDMSLYTVPGHVPAPRAEDGERVWPSS